MKADKSVEALAQENVEETENSEVMSNPAQPVGPVAKKTYFINEKNEIVLPGSKEAKASKALFLLVKEGTGISPALAAKYGFEDGVIGSVEPKKAAKDDKKDAK